MPQLIHLHATDTPDERAAMTLRLLGLKFDPAHTDGTVGFDLVAACSDGIDNDGDGSADLGDPGCASAGDLSETSAALHCDDGIDNDGDGLTDEDDIMIRRQAVTIDASSFMGCDGTNGNLDTSNQSWNYNEDMDATGFVSFVIYRAVSTANDKYLDVFITCNDAEGEPYDADEDGDPEAVHTQNDRYIEHAEGNTVALVE